MFWNANVKVTWTCCGGRHAGRACPSLLVPLHDAVVSLACHVLDKGGHAGSLFLASIFVTRAA